MITIRPYQPADEPVIIDITFKTGFKGEDLTGRDYCEDARLWYLIFIAYYARREPAHFFVAVEPQEDRLIGFICGSPDTLTQEAQFRRWMVPRIALHLFGYTIWRHSRSFKTVLGMASQFSSRTEQSKNDPIITQYPAHLHINVLPGYQSMGTGTRLMQHFEKYMRDLGAGGLHLSTTNKNHKAVPFYDKMGFSVVFESEIVHHPEFEDLRHLVFAKKP